MRAATKHGSKVSHCKYANYREGQFGSTYEISIAHFWDIWKYAIK